MFFTVFFASLCANIALSIAIGFLVRLSQKKKIKQLTKSLYGER